MASPNAKKRVMDLLKGTKATTGYYGLGDLAANTDKIVDKIYVAPTYSDADRAAIANAYATRPIPVLGEFPRTTKDLPAVFVFRISDGEAPKGVGGDEFGQDEGEETPTTHADVRGTFLEERLQLSLWVDGSPALRDDLYLAVRELLLRGRGYLNEADILAAEWTDGRDGQMYNPEDKPHIIHKAEAVLRYMVPLTWAVEQESILDIRQHLTDYQGRVMVEVWAEDM